MSRAEQNRGDWLFALFFMSLVLSLLGFVRLGPLVFAVPFSLMILLVSCGGFLNSLKVIGLYLLIIFGSIFLVEGIFYLITGEIKMTKEIFQNTTD